MVEKLNEPGPDAAPYEWSADDETEAGVENDEYNKAEIKGMLSDMADEASVDENIKIASDIVDASLKKAGINVQPETLEKHKVDVIAGELDSHVAPAAPPDSWASQVDGDMAIWLIRRSKIRTTRPSQRTQTRRVTYSGGTE